MIALLLALLAPAEIIGAPGETVTFHVELVGADTAQLSASEPLVLDTQTNTSAKVQARIDAKTQAGTYDAYLYAAPPGDGPIVVAAAQPVRVTVRDNSHEGIIAGTARSFREQNWWFTPVLILGALALLWVLGAFEVRLA